MASLAPSSSVADVFPGPNALAHSYNSRGELGAFVNPYGCSCLTCVDYVAAWSAPAAAADGAAESPVAARSSPAPAADGAAESPVALGPSATPWVVGPSLKGYVAPTPTPGSLTRALTGWGGSDPRLIFGRSSALAAAALPIAEVEEDEAASAPGLRGVDPEEDAVMARLQSLRARLLTEQDAVYSTECDSHDEMAALDVQWEELDSKISAIEQLLSAFGVVFRTR